MYVGQDTAPCERSLRDVCVYYMFTCYSMCCILVAGQLFIFTIVPLLQPCAFNGHNASEQVRIGHSELSEEEL